MKKAGSLIAFSDDNWQAQKHAEVIKMSQSIQGLAILQYCHSGVDGGLQLPIGSDVDICEGYVRDKQGSGNRSSVGKIKPSGLMQSKAVGL